MTEKIDDLFISELIEKLAILSLEGEEAEARLALKLQSLLIKTYPDSWLIQKYPYGLQGYRLQ